MPAGARNANKAIPVGSCSASASSIAFKPDLSVSASDAVRAVPILTRGADTSLAVLVPYLRRVAPIYTAIAVPDEACLANNASDPVEEGVGRAGGNAAAVEVDRESRALPAGASDKEEVAVAEVEKGAG